MVFMVHSEQSAAQRACGQHGLVVHRRQDQRQADEACFTHRLPPPSVALRSMLRNPQCLYRASALLVPASFLTLLYLRTLL
jgi:hypothetical protein